MRKILLIGLLLMATAMVNAQVVFYVPPPSELSGNYTSTYVSDSETTDWGSPNMDDPANAVQGEMVMAIDGTATDDSLLCEAVVNGDDVNGKIAVFYRGACEFGVKALNAQNAGAIAAVIINHSGEPIEMGGGVEGPNVTIPVFMISTSDGALLRPAIEAGGLEVWLFNKFEFYENDLGTTSNQVLRAEHFSHPAILANEPGEYVVQMGSSVINYGSVTQSNVSLSAVVTLNGNELYNEQSDEVSDMATSDTVTFDLPPLALDNFTPGFYNVTYEIFLSSEDEFPADNTISANFMISDSLFAYSRVDPSTGLPVNATGTRPADAVTSFHTCLAFQNSNAGTDEVFAAGLTFSGSMDEGELAGVTVDAYLYEWIAEFEDLDDPNFDLSNSTIEEITFGSFEYLSEDEEDEQIYIPFEEGPVQLTDDVRYLFCINHFTDLFRYGADNSSTDYAANLDFYNQPLFPIEINDVWNVAAFGTDNAPAITVNMNSPLFDAINEEAQRVEITPFPNPTANEINIPVGVNYGQTLIDIYDIAGKKVKSLNVTTTSFEILKVNVSDLDNGAYIFKMNFEDGSFSNFNVVVNN